MSGDQICPTCGKRVGKGSTHCIHCGAKLDSPDSLGRIELKRGSLDIESSRELEALEDVMIEMLGEEHKLRPTEPSGDSELETLPDLEDSELNEIQLPDENAKLEHGRTNNDLSWQVEEEAETDALLEPIEEIPVSKLAWDQPEIIEIDSDEVKEGNPFTEVEPPVVLDEMDDLSDETKKHLFPHDEEDPHDAVSHLFPKGRGVTTKEFIEVVVGKPQKVDIDKPLHELETPSCPQCGASISGDGFEYPGYVYEAMGKARMEHGEELLNREAHEDAIEEFEKAKKLFEHAENEKAAEDAIRRIDEGYEKMAESYYNQGESHKKDHQYEWAIVQYKKARELYMFTTQSKMRGKSAQKVRECYLEWGKDIEGEGDDLAKKGLTRQALSKYQEAAEKYRLGDDKKRLSGLEKKIKKA